MGFASLQYVRTLQERWDKDASTVTVELRCLWLERLEAVRALIGGRYGDGSQFEVPWILSVGTQGLHCVSVDIEPQGYMFGDFYCARLTATFAVEKMLDLNHNVFDMQVEIASEGMPLKGPGCKWGFTTDQTTNAPNYGEELTTEDSIPMMYFPYLEVTFKQKYMPRLRLQEFADAMGKCNDRPVPMGYDEFGIGQVRFLGAQESFQTVSIDTGIALYERNLKFGIRVNGGLGWDGQWRNDIGKYQEVLTPEMESRFGFTDLEQLFY